MQLCVVVHGGAYVAAIVAVVRLQHASVRKHDEHCFQNFFDEAFKTFVCYSPGKCVCDIISCSFSAPLDVGTPGSSTSSGTRSETELVQGSLHRSKCQFERNTSVLLERDLLNPYLKTSTRRMNEVDQRLHNSKAEKRALAAKTEM